MNNQTGQFVHLLQNSLKEGNTVHSISLFTDNRNCDEVKNNAWDLIPIISCYLTSEHEVHNVEVFKCCEQLMDLLAINSNPEEALLQFIEEIEENSDDTKFLCLLKPLSKILFRVPQKRLNSLAWCFNAIQTFLNKLDLPEECNLEGKQKLLMDSSEEYQRIVKLYTDLLPFYDMFIEEVKINKNKERIAVLRKFLIQLLGKPLAYLDMEIFSGVKSKARIVAENILAKIFQVMFDPLALIELRFLKENEELSRPKLLGTAVLFYLIYSQDVFVYSVPKVYNPIYLFQNTLHLVTELLSKSNQLLIEKGLKLASELLIVVDTTSLPYLLLDSKDHKEFCLALSNVIIYNEIETIRKNGLNIYKKYLYSFDIRGRYLLIQHSLPVLNHSGLIGFIITQYKEMLVNEFGKEEMSLYFKGVKLQKLLLLFAHLHKGEESDLLELFDQIMAVLNLLRYLSLRDKHNDSNIWDFFPELEIIYLKPLRRALELSRAHYELKIKEVKEGKAEGDKENGQSNVTITVGGHILPDMPISEKLKVLHQSLTAFDVMDSLLSRLVECIDTH